MDAAPGEGRPLPAVPSAEKGFAARGRAPLGELRGVLTRALELMLEVLARRDFLPSPGYEDMPATVARELLSRDDASPKAKEQARRYLRDYEA